jgi:hypothetical protein
MKFSRQNYFSMKNIVMQFFTEKKVRSFKLITQQQQTTHIPSSEHKYFQMAEKRKSDTMSNSNENSKGKQQKVTKVDLMDCVRYISTHDVRHHGVLYVGNEVIVENLMELLEHLGDDDFQFHRETVTVREYSGEAKVLISYFISHSDLTMAFDARPLKEDEADVDSDIDHEEPSTVPVYNALYQFMIKRPEAFDGYIDNEDSSSGSESEAEAGTHKKHYLEMDGRELRQKLKREFTNQLPDPSKDKDGFANYLKERDIYLSRSFAWVNRLNKPFMRRLSKIKGEDSDAKLEKLINEFDLF